jgi:hypothetical protein
LRAQYAIRSSSGTPPKAAHTVGTSCLGRLVRVGGRRPRLPSSPSPGPRFQAGLMQIKSASAAGQYKFDNQGDQYEELASDDRDTRGLRLYSYARRRTKLSVVRLLQRRQGRRYELRLHHLRPVHGHCQRDRRLLHAQYAIRSSSGTPPRSPISSVLTV